MLNETSFEDKITSVLELLVCDLLCTQIVRKWDRQRNVKKEEWGEWEKAEKLIKNKKSETHSTVDRFY